jgi:DNA-binding PadR family transcriptional regulator
MVETRLLALVLRNPHPVALARKVRDGSLFPALRQLEARGLLMRRRGLYRLTRRGRRELSMSRAVAHLIARTSPPRLR